MNFDWGKKIAALYIGFVVLVVAYGNIRNDEKHRPRER